jgi:hypothetical protein
MFETPIIAFEFASQDCGAALKAAADLQIGLPG